MAQRCNFQLLLIFVALTPVESKEFKSQSFLKEVLVSQPFQGRLYVITKQDRKINKDVARATCDELGGYLATLGAEMEEFEHIRKHIIESEKKGGKKGKMFLIDEANKDAPKLKSHPFRDKENCSFFIDMTGLNDFYPMSFAPCHYAARLICEVPLLKSKPTSTSLYEDTDPKLMLQRFKISPRHKGRIYLGSKHSTGFDIDKANSVCREYGGYLWEIETKDEFDFVKFLFRVDQGVFYTGGNDIASEGNFKWFNSGKRLTMTDGTLVPWYPGNPDNWNNEDCVVLWYDFELNDFTCSAKQKYICEVPVDVNE